MTSPAQAQRPDDRGRGGSDRGRGGPPQMTPDRIFGYMDRNKDGVLGPEETQRIPSHVRERLQKSGYDLKKGLDQKQFGKAFEVMRKVREEDDKRRREEYEKKKREEEKSQKKDEKEERKSVKEKPKLAMKPKPRVTIDLPSKFEEGDTDLDGQVAFYEWRTWKRSETDNFFAYDHNGDGFLTPKELAKGPNESTLAAIEAAKQLPSESVPSSAVATSSKPQPVKTVKVASVPSGSVDMDSATAKRGKSMFRLLDKDRSGNVTPDEWKRSSKLQPMFADGGMDLSKPMDETTFITNYVKLSS